MKISIGDKIKFKSEVQRYTVIACNDRFVIAWKPFNPKRTFTYTLIDLKENQRSSDNYYCRFDYTDSDEAHEALKMLDETAKRREDNEYDLGGHGFWLSGRRNIELDIERVDYGGKKTRM